MPSSESGHETRPGRVQATTAAYPPPKLAEPLPCPRCNSVNTKFCYYNNYNLAQPRHFCKSCRRYWTHGGTLRDVPIGGGSRKSSSSSSAAKRARSSSSAASAPASSSSCSSSVITTTNHEPEPGPGPVSVPLVTTDPAESKDGDLVSGYGSFASLLSGQSGDGAFLALGSGTGLGYGYGFGYGFEEMGIGYSGYLGGGGGSGAAAMATVPAMVGGGGGGGDTWQMGEMEGNGGDSFVWPGLEISMQGNNVK